MWIVLLGVPVALVARDPALAAAPVAPAELLASPTLRAMRRLGLAVVGPETAGAVAARNAVEQSFEGKEHEVVLLAPLARPPSRTTVLTICAGFTLDALVLVSISTAAGATSANIEIRNMNGDLFDVSPPEMGYGYGMQSTFSFPTQGVAPTAGTPAAGPPPPAGKPSGTPDAPASLLWFDNDKAFLGSLPLRDSQLYEVTGHPDLTARYQLRSGWKRGLGIGGWVSLGVGLPTALAEVIVESSVCSSDRAHCDDRPIYYVPFALIGVGVAALIASAIIVRDPLSPEERLRLARDYNQQELRRRPRSSLELSVSPAPTADAQGAALLLNGSF